MLAKGFEEIKVYNINNRSFKIPLKKSSEQLYEGHDAQIMVPDPDYIPFTAYILVSILVK